MVFSTTIDAVREINFKPGYCWILDEMKPADGTQAIYMSEDLMKNLLDPRTSKSIRAKNQELNLHMGIPRICTANAENIEEWCGYRLKWSYPLQRKAIVFQINDYLVDEEWRKQHKEGGQQEDNDNGNTEAMRVMNESYAGRLPPGVQPEQSRIARAAQNTFRWLFAAVPGASSSRN